MQPNSPHISIVGSQGSIDILLRFFQAEGIAHTYHANPEHAEYVFIYSHPILPMLQACKTLKKKVLIFITGEACTPDFNLFDYAFGYDKLSFGDRYLQIQFQALLCYPLPSKKNTGAEALKTKTDFCNFIYSNPKAHPNRDVFFHQLCEYKTVDSLGKHLTNIAGKIGERNASDYFMESVLQKRPYKFSIAFENALHPGYNTEKIISSMLANTIPIFWGDPDIGRIYNTKAFINCHDYTSFSDVIRHIKELNEDDRAYASMLNEPWKTEAQADYMILQKNNFIEQINHIFTQPYAHAFRKPTGTYNQVYTGIVSDYNKLEHVAAKQWKSVHHMAHLVKKWITRR